ncbi:hypothetical protein FXO37_20719 [Capsicum annuum]|nr:hypothetical protein FXO37_20719 [Capsicum annuum]
MEIKCKREADLAANTGKGNYLQILHQNKWTRRETEVVEETEDNGVLKAETQLEEKDLSGEMHGRELSGKKDAPTRNEVRSWAHQTWKGSQGIQVYDMNESLFLFEF